MGNKIWNGVALTLYLYRNESKIDDLLSRLWGHLVSSISVADGKQSQRTASLTAKLGSLAALLGIGEVGGTLQQQETASLATTKITSLSYENKVAILREFFRQHEDSWYVNAYEGTRYAPQDGASISDWPSTPLTSLPTDVVGNLLGRFWAYGMSPSPVNWSGGPGNPIDDIMSGTKALWEFRTVADSKLRASIPWLTRFIIDGSQHALVGLAKSLASDGSGAKINAFGLLRADKNGDLSCEPISFQLWI